MNSGNTYQKNHLKTVHIKTNSGPSKFKILG